MDYPKTWAEFTWPDWVPGKLRGEIESFWADGYGDRGPQGWAKNAAENHAPEFGSLATLCALCAPTDQPESYVTGRYIHAWSNMGRIASPLGFDMFEYVSLHTPPADMEIDSFNYWFRRIEEERRLLLDRAAHQRALANTAIGMAEGFEDRAEQLANRVREHSSSIRID